MQCRSFEELATDARFLGACEIRSVYARPYESHDDLGRNGIGHVVISALSPSTSSLSRLYATSVRFYRIKCAELHRNRYSSVFKHLADASGASQTETPESTGFPNIE